MSKHFLAIVTTIVCIVIAAPAIFSLVIDLTEFIIDFYKDFYAIVFKKAKKLVKKRKENKKSDVIEHKDIIYITCKKCGTVLFFHKSWNFGRCIRCNNDLQKQMKESGYFQNGNNH